MKLLNKGVYEATLAHCEQKRKYTNEPYIVHPLAVKDILIEVGITDEDILTAAVMHDTIEDTLWTVDALTTSFNHEIAQIVFYSSSITQLCDITTFNRAMRKKIDRQHYCNGDIRSWLVKVGDALDNSKTILMDSPKFGKVFLHEKYLLILDIAKKININDKYSQELMVLCNRWISMYFGKF